MINYKDIRILIGKLNRVAGFIQFSGEQHASKPLQEVMEVIRNLEAEVDTQMEELVKEHENCVQS